VWTQAARKAQGVEQLGHGAGPFHRRNRAEAARFSGEGGFRRRFLYLR
jgi:hypothetical protein